MKRLKQQTPLLTSEELVLKAYQTAIHQKSLDAVAYDLRDLTDITDCTLIVSGTSERHCLGIAAKIQETLENFGEHPCSVTGKERGEWIILDYSNVVVHVFHEYLRQYYNLEELWTKASKLKGDTELEAAAKAYRTRPL